MMFGTLTSTRMGKKKGKLGISHDILIEVFCVIVDHMLM